MFIQSLHRGTWQGARCRVTARTHDRKWNARGRRDLGDCAALEVHGAGAEADARRIGVEAGRDLLGRLPSGVLG